MVIIRLKAILFILDNIFFTMGTYKRVLIVFLRSLTMNEKEIIQEYRDKIKECDEIIRENTQLNLKLREALKEIEDLKQNLQDLIELNA